MSLRSDLESLADQATEGQECQFGRQSAKNVLEEQRERSSKKAQAVDLLISLIPWDTLSSKQESLLYGLLVKL